MPVREAPPLVLGQGEQRLLSINGLKKYSIGSKILRALPAPHDPKNTLLVKAIQPGETDLWVWKTNGETEHRAIQIRKWRAPQDKRSQHLEKALSQLEEVEIILSGVSKEAVTTYLLRGEVHSMREAAVIRAITKGFPGDVIDETEISLPLLSRAEKDLSRWLAQSRHAQNLTLERNDENGTLWLIGSIASPKLREEVERKAYSLFPLTKLALDSMPDDAPTLHFKVYLLELKKSMMRSLGVDWPGSTGGALKASPWGVKQAIALEAAISHLEAEGNGKILSQPELVVRAPGEAELFAGGEIPIETKSRESAQLSWRPYGLLLKLKVAHASGRKVRLDIHTEVSHVDPKLAIDKIPGIQANRMKTQVDATFGSPLLLSGLLQESVRKAARGIPYLRQIPVLGLLFGSEDYLQERSELVAILLPSIAPPAAPMSAVTNFTVRGKAPPPRNWISPAEEIALRAHPDFPWNALEGENDAETPL